MAIFLDARIPVVFGATPGANDAVLVPDTTWEAAHPVACACCVGRGPAVQALDQLFLDRVKGLVPWFTRVVVPDDADGLVRAALADSVVSARFRVA